MISPEDETKRMTRAQIEAALAAADSEGRVRVPTDPSEFDAYESGASSMASPFATADVGKPRLR